MTALEATAAWWGYAEGDVRLVGAVVVAIAIAALAFVGRRLSRRSLPRAHRAAARRER